MQSILNAIRKAFSPAEVSPDQLAAAKTTVENLISSSRVAVFSKAYCPYCKRASALLETRGYGSITKTIQLDQVKDGSTIQSYLAQRGGVSRVTVPQIYIDQKLIGGCDDIMRLDSQGKLAQLLA